MPHDNWFLKKISTGEYLETYDVTLANCTWTTILLAAKHYPTNGAVDTDIESWGETPGVSFIGQNPPPH